MNLHDHNLAQIPQISEIYQNERHLLSEFVQEMNMSDPDVRAALEDRVSEILLEGGEGARMSRNLNNTKDEHA